MMIINLALPDGNPFDRDPPDNVARFDKGTFWPADLSDSIVLQQNVIRHMAQLGPGAPSGVVDRRSGKALTLGEYFDAHALCMSVIGEVEARHVPGL